MKSFFSLTQIAVGLLIQFSPAQSLTTISGNSSSRAILFEEVLGRSRCRTLETLVQVIEEHPEEVEHMLSPTCVTLQRCGGCCSSEHLECQPTLTSNLTMQLLKFHLMGNLKEYITLTFVEHQICACRPKETFRKSERRRMKGKGRKRKDRRDNKHCDTCRPPRR